MKIIVDQEVCIGAASCVAIAAKTFGLNGDGKVYLLEEGTEGVSKNEAGEAVSAPSTQGMDVREVIIEAARSCPVSAIAVFEDSGERIVL